MPDLSPKQLRRTATAVRVGAAFTIVAAVFGIVLVVARGDLSSSTLTVGALILMAVGGLAGLAGAGGIASTASARDKSQPPMR